MKSDINQDCINCEIEPVVHAGQC